MPSLHHMAYRLGHIEDSMQETHGIRTTYAVGKRVHRQERKPFNGLRSLNDLLGELDMEVNELRVRDVWHAGGSLRKRAGKKAALLSLADKDRHLTG